ncbi:EamA family transporter [Rhizobium leguminosarum]|nr:EamA family transporter [Rhizobium leguminosarum]MBY5577269.1 EamA family transporter [Rhizobium leguminosarum]
MPLWALWPLFALVSTEGMPTYQFLAVTYGTAALTMFGFGGRRARPGAIRRLPVGPAIMVAIGMLLSNILFVMSLDYMPAAQANLIVYLWPVTVVILASR